MNSQKISMAVLLSLMYLLRIGSMKKIKINWPWFLFDKWIRSLDQSRYSVYCLYLIFNCKVIIYTYMGKDEYLTGLSMSWEVWLMMKILSQLKVHDLSNVSVATWGDNGKNVFFLWSPGRVHIINKINEENDGKRKKNIYTFKYIPLIIMWGVIFM